MIPFFKSNKKLNPGKKVGEWLGEVVAQRRVSQAGQRRSAFSTFFRLLNRIAIIAAD